MVTGLAQVPEALAGVPFSTARYRPETSALAQLLSGAPQHYSTTIITSTIITTTTIIKTIPRVPTTSTTQAWEACEAKKRYRPCIHTAQVSYGVLVPWCLGVPVSYCPGVLEAK